MLDAMIPFLWVSALGLADAFIERRSQASRRGACDRIFETTERLHHRRRAAQIGGVGCAALEKPEWLHDEEVFHQFVASGERQAAYRREIQDVSATPR